MAKVAWGKMRINKSLGLTDASPEKISGAPEGSPRSSPSATVIADLVRKIQDILVSRSVNKYASDNVYQMLRTRLLAEPSVRRSVPQFVVNCGDLDQFFKFIQRKFPIYNMRQEYVTAAFAPRLARLETAPTARSAGRIFIGHGRSHQWRVLKDFLKDRLGLE